MDVSKGGETPRRQSEHEPSPIQKLIFCLKGPSEFKTGSGLLLLGHRSGSAGAFSRQQQRALQAMHSFMEGGGGVIICNPLTKMHE